MELREKKESKGPQLFTYFNGTQALVPMMKRDSKKQVFAQFTTELVQGRSDKCVALAIPYEVWYIRVAPKIVHLGNR